MSISDRLTEIAAESIDCQNTIVFARDVAAAAKAGYPHHLWAVVTPHNIKIAARGMQARYAVAVDLADSQLTEMLVHASVAPAFVLDGAPQMLRVTAKRNAE